MLLQLLPRPAAVRVMKGAVIKSSEPLKHACQISNVAMALTAKKLGCKVLSFLDVILDLLFVAVTVYNGVYSFQASLPSREAVAHLFDDCVRNGNNECAQHYWNYGDIITHGFWNTQPSVVPFFSGFSGRNRCVPLFEGSRTLSDAYSTTKYLFSSVPGRAFLGVCTNAPIQKVDSIFGSEARLFKEPVYNALNFKTNFYPFVASSRSCDCNPAVQICSNKFASFFSDGAPGFDPVIFWKNYVFLNAGDGVCAVNKLDIRPNPVAPDCSSVQGFHPVFYHEPTSWTAFFAIACAIQFVFCVLVELIVIGVAIRNGKIKDIRSGIVMSLFSIFMKGDANHDNVPSSVVLRVLYTSHLITSGIILVHLNLSGGCPDFPGRTQVIILLVFNYLKLFKKDFQLGKLCKCASFV